MSDFDEFFSDGDKPYAENLNDSLLLMDAFNVTVPLAMPSMFTNGEFNSNTGITRKCGVSLVTLQSVDNGVTVGTNSISGTGDIVFRVYPNFNSFYKWNKILLSKTGTVSISFQKTDGTQITATIGSDGLISDSNALKELAEIDVVLSLTSATVNSILIEFINNQSSNRDRTGALLEASQLVNINGTVTSGETKAVNGGTVYTALDEVNTDMLDRFTEMGEVVYDKEDSYNRVNVLDNKTSHYPNCRAVQIGLDAKENLTNKVTTLDNSSTNYPSTSAIEPLIDMIAQLIEVSFTQEQVLPSSITVKVSANVIGLDYQVTYQGEITYTGTMSNEQTFNLPQNSIIKIFLNLGSRAIELASETVGGS